MKRLASCAFLLAACSVETSVPGEAAIDCREAADCPAGLVCVVDLERCLPQGGACVELVDGAHRSAAPGRRCLADGEADGVCLDGLCRLSRCGDGVLDRDRQIDPEVCDDGPLNSDLRPGACRSDCRPASCGDGVQDPGEECDDGNQVQEDGCLVGCRLNRCGDGHRNPAVEECDDGNDRTDDACPAACTRAVCGDPYQWAGVEECDDQNDDPNDGCNACLRTRWRPELLVGHGEGSGVGTAIALNEPYAVAADTHGGVYVADTWHNRVLRLDPATGRVVVAAGTGKAGYGGDGGPATAAQLDVPVAIAVDPDGNLFISDGSLCIRRVDALTGIVQTVAGTPFESGYSGDGGLATLAHVGQPDAIAVDGRGSLFLVNGNRVRWVDPLSGIIETFVGNGECTPTGPTVGPALEVEVCSPSSLAIDSAGRLNFCATVRDADGTTLRDEVRRVDAAGRTVEVVAQLPEGCAGMDLADDDTLAVATYLETVVRISAAGQRRVIAGTGTAGFSGDGGPAFAAQLRSPMGVAWATDGALFVADSDNHRVRRIEPGSERIETVVGSGSLLLFPSDCALNSCRSLYDVEDVAVDVDGRIAVALGELNVIVEVDPGLGTVEIVAGSGWLGEFGGDGGPAVEARLNKPTDLAFDPLGNLYFTDLYNDRIRRVDAATGVVTTVAGGDGSLNDPKYLALSPSGDLYVSDLSNRVLKVDPTTGAASVFAGTGAAGYSGDGGPAVAARLRNPRGLAFDALGGLLIADLENHVVRRVGADGSIETIAGTGTAGSAGDGGAPTAAQLDGPLALQVGPGGEIYVADISGHRVRRISADLSRITTLAGTGDGGPASGDGGPASTARLQSPTGLALDAQGRLLVSEKGARRLRVIDLATGLISTLIGEVTPPGDGPLATSRLGAPLAIAPMSMPDGRRLRLVADGQSGRVRGVDLAGANVETLVGYPNGFTAEGAAAWSSRLLELPAGIAGHPSAGLFYVSEAAAHVVREVDVRTSPWRVTTLAGTYGEPGFGPGNLYGPHGLLLDEEQQVLFVADTGNHAVRAISVASGDVTTVAGRPVVRGFGGDGAALESLLDAPVALARGADGCLYVAEQGSHRVRRVEAPLGGSPQIETVLGYGVPGTWGEGAPASAHPVDTPRGLAVDGRGNLFVAGAGAVRVVSAGPDGLAKGGDAVSFVYGGQPQRTQLEELSLCLAGLEVTDGPGGPDSRLLVLDSCRGYLIALDRQSTGGVPVEGVR